MRCKHCRKQIPDNARFCCYCGQALKKEELYRRKDGLYEKIKVINGKRVAFRGKKKQEVYNKIALYKEEEKQGLFFRDVAEQWYDEHWETLSPTTQRGYKFAYEEIKGYFGDERIRSITAVEINKYMKQLPKTYARKTCATRLMLLNMIFKYAISEIEDCVSYNPCESISISKNHKSTKRKAPSESDINKIKLGVSIEHNGFPVGLLALFLLYTGLRKGEALALQYKDIDRNNARISITKSVYYTSNSPQIKKPKTEAGIRQVVIPASIINLLPKGKASQYVFSVNPFEGPVRQHIFDKAWKYWQSETGTNITAHQLRHGYATLLHEANIDVKDAQALLGHADASTTQNIYTEVSNTRIEAVEKKINSYLQ